MFPEVLTVQIGEQSVAGATTASHRISRFASDLVFDQIPAYVAEAAKLHLLDTLGCGLAAHALGIAVEARAMAIGSGAGGEASVIGAPTRLPATAAALANGALCHGLDFDDTHPGSICHVGVVVSPAALAAAEAAGADGRALLVGLVVGSEVTTQVGRAAAHAYMTRGFHPTSVCGVFGAAAAAARISGLDVAETSHALGLCGSMASGLFEYLSDGAPTKPLHAGWAAQAGVTAAALAARGAAGPSTVFEGRFGLYAAYFDSGADELAASLEELGRNWETPRIAYKAYPSCHFIHGCLDAVAALVPVDLALDEIAELVVSIPDAGIPLVLEPREAKVAPRTTYDAKFSLQYSLAAMLVHRHVGVATYTELAIAEPAVLDIARRVTYEYRTFSSYPTAFPGFVRVRLRSGRVFEQEVAYQRGAAENPLSRGDILAKFRANASLALGEVGVATLERAVLSLEEQPDLQTLLALLRSPEPVREA